MATHSGISHHSMATHSGISHYSMATLSGISHYSMATHSGISHYSMATHSALVITAWPPIALADRTSPFCQVGDAEFLANVPTELVPESRPDRRPYRCAYSAAVVVPVVGHADGPAFVRAVVGAADVDERAERTTVDDGTAPRRLGGLAPVCV